MLLKEYIVTLKNKQELDGFYAEMESEGLYEFLPNRPVECVKRRPISRNTHYLLSAEEAEQLRLDPRVKAVELTFENLGLRVIQHSSQTANFNRSDSMVLDYKNWGLYRSSIGQNIAGWTDIGVNANRNATINLGKTASNVDVIIVDEIMYPNHDEFGNRAQQFDWFANYDSQVRTTGCDIVRIERTGTSARITTRSAHGLNAGNVISVVCNTNGTFNETNATVTAVSSTPVGSGGDGVTVNRISYTTTASGTVSVNTRAVSSIERSSNIVTVVCATSHNLTTGDTIGINITSSGYTSFAAANVSVTVVNATTFRYTKAGADLATTVVTGNVFLDDASGSWTGKYLYPNYSSGNNHATVVGGIIGGATQGWARGATLYNIRHDYNSLPANNFVPLEYVFDYIRYWQQDKIANPLIAERPTLVNCSWGIGVSTSARNYATGNLKTVINSINYQGANIRPEDVGNDKIDTGFSGVCNANTVYGEFKGAQTASTTANVTINSSTSTIGSGIVPVSSLTGTISVGDYMNTNVVGWPLHARVIDVQLSGSDYIVNYTFLKATTITGTSTATCTFYSSVMENVAFSVTTPSGTSATVNSITLSLGGSAGMTDLGAPTSSGTGGVDIYDDAGWACQLPFDINYLGVDYGPSHGSGTVGDSAYVNVSTNSYAIFGGGLTLCYNYLPDPTGPAVRKVCISGGDRSARKCYTQTTGVTPNRTFRIRWEGHEAANGGDVLNPTMIWEMKFFEATPQTFEVHVGSNAAYRGEFDSSQLLDYGIDLNSTTAPQRNAALEADIDDCIAEGVIFVGSAGNQNYKIDVLGGVDYDNNYIVNGLPYYYHRGSSPGAHPDIICVGSLNASSLENKSQASNPGPRVDLYAPGVNIASSVYDVLGPGIGGTTGGVRDNTTTVAISTVSRAGGIATATIVTAAPHGFTTGDVFTLTDCSISSYNTYMATVTVTNTTTFTYTNSGSTQATTSATGTIEPGYWYQKYSGTSIAAAQVSGVLALALEEYPTMSQEEAKTYITRYARPNLMFDSAGGYTDNNSLQGGPNRILYYNKERQTEGSILPKLNYKVRPLSGSVYPRIKIRRT